MADDVSFALGAWKENRLSYAGQFSVLRAVMSAWTEFEGKILGCRYWTKLALGVYQLDKPKKRRLRHEHVLPKTCVMAMLRSLDNPTPDAVQPILEKHLIGAVVTDAEDEILSAYYKKSMPGSCNSCPDSLGLDPWLRYKENGIEVVDLDSLPPEAEARAMTKRTIHLRPKA